jgi:hypothetical protein
MRQQQGMTLLKPLFRNFNTMKKELFKRHLSIIMSYMPDGQVLRVLGQNERYTIDPESGIIVDTTSAIMNEETGEVEDYGLKANLRDVRQLEYNVVAEEAPGNMTKRMMELQALLEMQEQVPVPPEQIIEKMEISASEKTRWLDYIAQQEESQAQQQEQMMQKEMQYKERELGQRDKELEQDFLVDMTKIKQMAEKDEKALNTKFAQMEVQQKQALLQFSQQMAQIASQADQEESQARAAAQSLEIDATKGALDLTQDAVAADQDLVQDEMQHAQGMYQDDAKHAQNMRFTQEKNAIALKGAEEKNTQAIKFAKEKAAQAAKQAKEQGGAKDGKGKPTTDA